MPELTDEILAAWLRPASVTFEPGDLTAMRAVTTRVRAKLTPTTAFHLVGIAYGVGSAEGRSWLVQRVREAQPEFVDVGQDALIGRLACCSIYALLDNGKVTGTLLCLLAQSAAFVGGAPVEQELHGVVERAQRDMAARARARPEWDPIAATVAEILSGGPRPAEEGQDAETHMDVHDRAISRIADAVDQLAEHMKQRAEISDEEYNALWWSYTRLSETTRTSWGEVDPLPRRIVLAADELGGKVTLIPSPPMVRGLLALALEGQVDKEVTLQDVIVAAAENSVRVAQDSPSRLTPISAGVAKLTELGSDDNTWSSVLAKTMSLDVSSKHSALDAAMQLVREVEIEALR